MNRCYSHLISQRGIIHPAVAAAHLRPAAAVVIALAVGGGPEPTNHHQPGKRHSQARRGPFVHDLKDETKRQGRETQKKEKKSVTSAARHQAQKLCRFQGTVDAITSEIHEAQQLHSRLLPNPQPRNRNIPIITLTNLGCGALSLGTARLTSMVLPSITCSSFRAASAAIIKKKEQQEQGKKKKREERHSNEAK